MTTITLSYNEVATLARKAARGAGLPFGIAEDIGRSAVWLASLDLDAVDAVVSSLSSEGQKRIIEGVAAIDRMFCGDMTEGVSVIVGDGGPVLVGLAAMAAADLGADLVVEASDGIRRPLTALTIADARAHATPRLHLSRGKAMTPPPEPKMSGRPAPTSITAYEQALELAARTYVPSSAASRSRGAGAGITDND